MGILAYIKKLGFCLLATNIRKPNKKKSGQIFLFDLVPDENRLTSG